MVMRVKVRMREVMEEYSVCVEFVFRLLVDAHIIFVLFGRRHNSPLLLLSTAEHHPDNTTNSVNDRTDYKNDLPFLLRSL
jgi:hypothetical protein